MVDFTLIYGLRLYHGPASDVARVEPMKIFLHKETKELRVTAHVIEGTSREKIKEQLLRSLDAFFELH
jgi:hypothetical protein